MKQALRALWQAWLWLFSDQETKEHLREQRRDPDLDYAKQQIESHEYRLQWLERTLEAEHPDEANQEKSKKLLERRRLPRH